MKSGEFILSGLIQSFTAKTSIFKITDEHGTLMFQDPVVVTKTLYSGAKGSFEYIRAPEYSMFFIDIGIPTESVVADYLRSLYTAACDPTLSELNEYENLILTNTAEDTEIKCHDGVMVEAIRTEYLLDDPEEEKVGGECMTQE